MDELSSVELLENWRSGDETAAAELFNRYVNQLVGLARTRLSERMKRRVEPEDVVPSAYRSFFRKAGDGRYNLEKSGDLWKLLTAITVSKIRGQVEFHMAQKRQVYAEESIAANKSFRVHPEAVVRDPTPDDAAALEEELKAIVTHLDPLQSKILELALADHSTDEIAEKVQRSVRTVRRTIQAIRQGLEKRLFEQSQAAGDG